MHVTFLEENIDDRIFVGHAAGLVCVSNACSVLGGRHR